MNSVIICPVCGKIIEKLKIQCALNFKYFKCPFCQSYLTKPVMGSVIIAKIRDICVFLIKILILILTIISVINGFDLIYQTISYTLFQMYLLCAGLALLFAIVICEILDDLIWHIEFKIKRNGFLTFISSNRKQAFTYEYESEIKSSDDHISNEDEFCSAVVVLLEADLKMSVIYCTDIKKIQLYYVYKLACENADGYVLLTDYLTDGDSVTLFLKCIGNINCKAYLNTKECKLLSSDNKEICAVECAEQILPEKQQ